MNEAGQIHHVTIEELFASPRFNAKQSAENIGIDTTGLSDEDIRLKIIDKILGCCKSVSYEIVGRTYETNKNREHKRHPKKA